jgi:hypothetical protein
VTGADGRPVNGAWHGAARPSAWRDGGPPLDRRRVTGMPAEPDVVDDALRLLVDLAQSSVDGADGVSLSLLRYGLLSTVVATNQIVLAMDSCQYATGEGPCVDASLRGHRFHAESLRHETRWPAFTPQARELGINAIFSAPVRSHAIPVGALNICSRTVSAFTLKSQRWATVFALKASEILSDAGVGATDNQLALRFHEALRRRQIISLANDAIKERDESDAKDKDAEREEEDAFSALLHVVLHG